MTSEVGRRKNNERKGGLQSAIDDECGAMSENEQEMGARTDPEIETVYTTLNRADRTGNKAAYDRTWHDDNNNKLAEASGNAVMGTSIVMQC